ncbi:hypothetical protein ONE63_001318 [Megalurothrips usitatus]|uniref:Uncharacterized protein n=1 Tax=Megalurothrips usitatus TaxID=439358 RepID=A0AAV7XEU8_9NEOP|nr:hypothetical protein ONE63_001318 [Megalurothrips usitatus]
MRPQGDRPQGTISVRLRTAALPPPPPPRVGPEQPVQLPAKEDDGPPLELDKYPVFPSLRDEDLERLGVLAAQAEAGRARAVARPPSSASSQGRPVTPTSSSSSPVGSPVTSNGFG